ncbi:hypothetical protein GEMRC1_013499 [Eukaryota sp. GEM-RC1]
MLLKSCKEQNPRDLIANTPPPLQLFDNRKNSCSVPPYIKVYRYVYNIFKRAQVEPELIISSVLYLQRLLKKRPDVKLTPVNFERLVFVSLMIASKFGDDVSCSSYSFSIITNNQLTLRQLNELEAVYLTEIDFNLYISYESYRQIYYDLKKIWTHLQVDPTGDIIPSPKSLVVHLELPPAYASLYLFHCPTNVPDEDHAAGLGGLDDSPRPISNRSRGGLFSFARRRIPTKSRRHSLSV